MNSEYLMYFLILCGVMGFFLVIFPIGIETITLDGNVDDVFLEEYYFTISMNNETYDINYGWDTTFYNFRNESVIKIKLTKYDFFFFTDERYQIDVVIKI